MDSAVLCTIQSISSSHGALYPDQTIQNYTKYFHLVWRCFWNTIWRQLTWKRKARNRPLWRKNIIYATVVSLLKGGERRSSWKDEGKDTPHPPSSSINCLHRNWWVIDDNEIQNECYMNSQIWNLHVCGSKEEGHRSWTEMRGMHNY